MYFVRDCLIMRMSKCETKDETYHADVGPGVQLLEGLRGDGLSKHLQVHPREFGQPQAAAVL